MAPSVIIPEAGGRGQQVHGPLGGMMVVGALDTAQTGHGADGRQAVGVQNLPGQVGADAPATQQRQVRSSQAQPVKPFPQSHMVYGLLRRQLRQPHQLRKLLAPTGDQRKHLAAVES